MPSLACIIPVVGNTDGLESTLVSVLERRPDTCEVFVVLNVPYHDPYDLQGEIQFLQAAPGAGLVDCINLGISATRAPIIHLLASGFEVDSGWIERALVHFDDPRIAAVTPFVYDRNNHERIVAAGVSCGRGGRKIVHHSMPTENGFSSEVIGPLSQAAFYRRSALEALGGGMPMGVGDDLADIDLAGSFRQSNWRMKLEPACRIFTSPIEKRDSGGFEAGLSSERFYWRHFGEAGGLLGFFSHCLVVIRDLMRCKPLWKAPAELFGRLTAFCQFDQYRKYRQLLVAARNGGLVAQDQCQSIQERASDPKAATKTTHRVDVPHEAIKPQNSGNSRRAYRHKKCG